MSAAKLNLSGSPSNTPPAVFSRANCDNCDSDGMYQKAASAAAIAAAAAAFLKFRRAHQMAGRIRKQGNVHFVSIPMPAEMPNAMDQRTSENSLVLISIHIDAATMAQIQ